MTSSTMTEIDRYWAESFATSVLASEYPTEVLTQDEFEAVVQALAVDSEADISKLITDKKYKEYLA